jgi:hypothetical protein
MSIVHGCSARVHVAALGCTRTAPCFAVRRCAWLGVYSATRCTVESSRAESGAWWWHCAYPCCSTATAASPSHQQQQAPCHTAKALSYGPIELIYTMDALRVEHLVGVLDSGAADRTQRLAHLRQQVRTRLAHAHVVSREDDVVLGRVEAHHVLVSLASSGWGAGAAGGTPS